MICITLVVTGVECEICILLYLQIFLLEDVAYKL